MTMPAPLAYHPEVKSYCPARRRPARQASSRGQPGRLERASKGDATAKTKNERTEKLMVLDGNLEQIKQEAEKYFDPDFGLSMDLLNQITANLNLFNPQQSIIDAFKMGLMQGIKLEKRRGRKCIK